LSNLLDASFCIEALEDELIQGRPEIFNTNQGGQITGDDFTGVLHADGIAISMDGRGSDRAPLFFLDSPKFVRDTRQRCYSAGFSSPYPSVENGGSEADRGREGKRGMHVGAGIAEVDIGRETLTYRLRRIAISPRRSGKRWTSISLPAAARNCPTVRIKQRRFLFDLADHARRRPRIGRGANSPSRVQVSKLPLILLRDFGRCE
jgi:hypothetical protein